jgi:hypothetical protein
MKRYLYILGVIVVVAVLIVLGLFLWKNTSAGLPAVQTGTTGTLPSTGTQGSTGNTANGGTGATGTTGTGSSGGTAGVVAGSFGPLSNDSVLDYYVAPNNSILALESNGAIASITNGKLSYMSTSTASNIIGGSFSYDGKKALLNFGDASNPQTSIFDVASHKWTALPQGIQSPRWSSSDYRIAYMASVATGTERLATINAATPKNGSSILLSMHAQDLSVQWVNKTQFVLSDKPSVYAPGSAWLFDSSSQSLTPIALSLPGLESAWSVGGTTKNSASLGLLFFAPSSGQSSNVLQLVNTAGTVLQGLSIQTLPSKCGFTTPGTNSTATLALYCGIPRDATAFASANLPDDYNQMALFTSDSLYRINTQTGTLDTLWNDTNQNVDISDVKAANNEIFFIDRYTNKLYELTLQTALQ